MRRDVEIRRNIILPWHDRRNDHMDVDRRPGGLVVILECYY